MVRTKVGNDIIPTSMKFRIRLDFRGITKPGRLFFGGKNSEKAALEIRDQQIGMLRNVPVQGLNIDDIDLSQDLYDVYDDMINADVAYAPAIITVTAETMEDLLQFIVREEFRKIEILAPDNVILTKMEIERLMFKINEEVIKLLVKFERKLSNR